MSGLRVSSQSSQVSTAKESNDPLICGLSPSRKVDEYDSINLSEEKARLDKFTAILDKEQEETSGFIVTYASRGERFSAAQKRADRAKEYIVNKSVFYNERINTLDCGYREEQRTELWMTTAGAAPPTCSPTVKPSRVKINGRGKRRP